VGWKSLNDRDRAAAPASNPLLDARPPAKPPEHRTHEHADHGSTQVMIPRHHVAEPVWNRQHPLTDRDRGKHVVDQMRGAFGHAPAPARGTDRPRLARKRHEPIRAAPVASEPGEPACEPAAPQEPAKLLVDELREPLAVTE
jgi:hypothetical protein